MNANLVDKNAIQTMNVQQIWDEIQQNKRCFAKMSYIRHYFAGIYTPGVNTTTNVLADWLNLMDNGEFYGQEQMREYPGLARYREQYNKIDTAALTPEQKQIIKDYYVRILPSVANPANQNNIVAAAPVVPVPVVPAPVVPVPVAAPANFANNNNNNNDRTIFREEFVHNFNNLQEGNWNWNRNNANNRSVVSLLTQGGKSKKRTRRSPRRSKKTRKH
jgi:hypothetical protein